MQKDRCKESHTLMQIIANVNVLDIFRYCSEGALANFSHHDYESSNAQLAKVSANAQESKFPVRTSGESVCGDTSGIIPIIFAQFKIWPPISVNTIY